MEDSGKVIKARNKKPIKVKQNPKKSNVLTASQVAREEIDPLPRPGTARTLDANVEEIFQV